MTAATPATVRLIPARSPRLGSPLSFLRLLRIELRRNVMPWLLPLIAALFWFDSYRPSSGTPALYVLRTFWNMGQGHTIIDSGPLVAGAAAWTGSRDGRRRTTDLVTGTARSRWVAQLAAWAATAIWAVAAYLAFTGAMFAAYAAQGVQGQPPWWWVAVGAAAVGAFSAAGFAIGVLWPSRFAPPLAAFGGFLVMMMSSQTGFHDLTGWAQILPTNSYGNFQPDSGLLYPWLPDLAIARIMLMAGITIAVLGLIGLRSTARLSAHGMVIPVLHDAASDQPLRYTPACGQAAGVPVCLAPAYRDSLGSVTAALRPVFTEVAGLPGAPTQAVQVAAAYDSADGGPGGLAGRGQGPVRRAAIAASRLRPALVGMGGRAPQPRPGNGPGLRRRPAAGGPAGHGPARLAHGPPARTAIWPAHPGAAAVMAGSVSREAYR